MHRNKRKILKIKKLNAFPFDSTFEWCCSLSCREPLSILARAKRETRSSAFRYILRHSHGPHILNNKFIIRDRFPCLHSITCISNSHRRRCVKNYFWQTRLMVTSNVIVILLDDRHLRRFIVRVHIYRRTLSFTLHNSCSSETVDQGGKALKHCRLSLLLLLILGDISRELRPTTRQPREQNY